jgi:hypothetical protein
MGNGAGGFATIIARRDCDHCCIPHKDMTQSCLVPCLRQHSKGQKLLKPARLSVEPASPMTMQNQGWQRSTSGEGSAIFVPQPSPEHLQAPGSPPKHSILSQDPPLPRSPTSGFQVLSLGRTKGRRTVAQLPASPHLCSPTSSHPRPLLADWEGLVQFIFWGTRPALLEEIKALKGKHKMSLLVLIKALGLTHLTTNVPFQSLFPGAPNSPDLGQPWHCCSGPWLF